MLHVQRKSSLQSRWIFLQLNVMPGRLFVEGAEFQRTPRKNGHKSARNWVSSRSRGRQFVLTILKLSVSFSFIIAVSTLQTREVSQLVQSTWLRSVLMPSEFHCTDLIATTNTTKLGNYGVYCFPCEVSFAYAFMQSDYNNFICVTLSCRFVAVYLKNRPRWGSQRQWTCPLHF